jgi:hypothetical protein
LEEDMSDSSSGKKILEGAGSIVVATVALAALGALVGGPAGGILGAKAGAALGGGKAVSGR